MKACLFFDKQNDTKWIARGKNVQPDKYLSQEEIAQGLMIDDETIPLPEKRENTYANLIYNPTDKTFSYEYVEYVKEPTIEERLASLEARVKDLELKGGI